jgi:hypothetical protein
VAYPQPAVNGFFSLAANDFIEVYFINGVAGVSMEGDATSNHFQGFLVSGT